MMLSRVPALHIQLLGGFGVAAQNGDFPGLHQPRLQALLAYLLLNRHAPQRRQEIAFRFWPDSNESQARTNLRKLLHTLRQLLPDADTYLRFTSESVHWQANAPYTFDVALVEEALEQDRNAEAVRYYKGDLLPGFYDDWIVVARERLRGQIMEALASLAQQHAAAGELQIALSYAQQWVSLDPLQESAYCQVMSLYLAQDDRAAALRTYHTVATLLREELGVDPNPAIEALYQQALHATPVVKTTVNATVVVPAPKTSTPVLPAALPLVGRRDHWRTLQQAWQQVQQGQPHFLLIEGEAGLGKTRLAEELSDLVRRQGQTALYTRAYAAEGTGAYAPLVDLLRSRPVLQRIGSMEAIWRGELARLLPELHSADPTLPLPSPIREPWQRRRLHEALARATLAESSSLIYPLLVHIDDLQWCDAETLAWLRFLLRFEPSAPLLVVGTVRPDEVEDTHPLHTLRRDLLRAGQYATIELEPLAPDAVAQLAAAVMRHELSTAEADQLFADTEGNPLFVVEMLRTEPSEGMKRLTTPFPAIFLTTGERARLPHKVQAVIQHRLAQLSPAARHTARVAAVIGRDFTFDLLQLAMMPTASAGDDLVMALDELWRRRIIREQGSEGYDFSHDRIREVAEAESGPLLRRRLHAQVAAALESYYAADLAPVSNRIAQHHEQAGERTRASIFYQQAGAYAAARFATEEAIQFYGRALANLPEGDWQGAYSIRMATDRVYVLQGQSQARRQNLEALVALLDAPNSPATLTQRALVLSSQAHYRRRSSEQVAGVTYGREAVALAQAAQTEGSEPEKAEAKGVEAEATYRLGDILWAQGKLDEARATLRHAARIAHEVGNDELEAHILEMLAATGMFSGLSVTQISAYLHQCLAIHQRRNFLYGQVSIYNKLYFLPLGQGEGSFAEAAAGYEKNVEVSRQIGALGLEGMLRSNLGYVLTFAGKYARVQHWLNYALSIGEMTHDELRQGNNYNYLGEYAFQTGDWEAAERYYRRAIDYYHKVESRHYMCKGPCDLARLLIWRGDAAAALPLLREALSISQTLRDTRFEANVWVRLGHAHRRLGIPEDAAAAYANALALRLHMEQYNRSQEARAGLVAVLHAQGDIAGALAGIEAILAHLAAYELDATDESLFVYQTCHRVLCELDDPRATRFLELARGQLTARAATIDDPALRQCFWSVPSHQLPQE
jgi:DNA-binding SARP family transcriptional activator/predicted ATPase